MNHGISTKDVLAIYEAELAQVMPMHDATVAYGKQYLDKIEATLPEVALDLRARRAAHDFMKARGARIPDADVLAIEMQAEKLERLTREKAEYEATMAPPDARLEAYRGTRTRVHEALQALGEPPNDPKEHILIREARHKAHFTDLWQEADRLVAAAGITEGGITKGGA